MPEKIYSDQLMRIRAVDLLDSNPKFAAMLAQVLKEREAQKTTSAYPHSPKFGGHYKNPKGLNFTEKLEDIDAINAWSKYSSSIKTRGEQPCERKAFDAGYDAALGRKTDNQQTTITPPAELRSAEEYVSEVTDFSMSAFDTPTIFGSHGDGVDLISWVKAIQQNAIASMRGAPEGKE